MQNQGTSDAPVITLLTDFGVSDAFVGIMKGVMLGICPAARLVDLTHAIAAQQILPAAMLLRSAVAFFPTGTVHLVVVDPGVGSARRGLVVEAASALLVGPDNGVLSLAADLLGVRRIFEIQPGPYTRPQVSHTFHGRDVFAPVAAHLADGIAAAQCGRPVDAMQRLHLPLARSDGQRIDGEVIYVDHFGNLITNIGSELLARFPAQDVSVSIGATHIRGLVSSYAAVPVAAPLALVASWDTLEIAVRNGNGAQTLGVGPGSPVSVVGGASTT